MKNEEMKNEEIIRLLPKKEWNDKTILVFFRPLFIPSFLYCFIISLYVITIPFNRGLVLPFVGEKLQLPELVFLFLAVASAPYFFKLLTTINTSRSLIGLKANSSKLMAQGLLIYFLAVVASAIFHPTRAAFLDVAGLIYLLTLYAIINVFFIFQESDNTRLNYTIPVLATRFTALSLFILSSIGLLGFLLLIFGIHTSLVAYYPNYPFFGNVYRVRAFTQEPVMMASILSVFILIVLAGYNLEDFTKKEKQFLRLTLALGFLALALTLTKSAVITFAAAFSIFSIRHTSLKKFTPFVWIISIVALLFFTHFVIVKKENFDSNQSYHGLVDAPSLSLGDYYLVETDYGSLKEAAFITGKRFWLTGIGSGNFVDYVPTLKKEGLYPTKFQDYDPISTYFGAFAELGIFGLCALLFFYLQVYRTLRQLKTQNPNDAGVGSGNFVDYVPTLKKEGLYPTKFQDYDPISTYFGAFAELGIFGLCALLFFYLQVYRTLRQLKTQNPNDVWIASLMPIFGFMACESFVTDTMNFRHYWWILACVAAYVRTTETYKSNTPQ